MCVSKYAKIFFQVHALIVLHVHFHTVHVIQLPSVKFPFRIGFVNKSIGNKHN